MRATRTTSEFSSNITRIFLQRRGLGWTAVVAVLAWGWLSARSLPQQEDPTFPTHDAVLITKYPGADIYETEQFVTAKLEAAIAKFSTVEKLSSRTRAGVSAIVITLHPSDEATIAREWVEVRSVIDKLVLPSACEQPELDTNYQLPATLLFSLTCAEAPDGKTPHCGAGELTKAAVTLADKLRKMPSVARVRMAGEAAREKVLTPYPGAMADLRLSLESLKKQLPLKSTSDGRARAFQNEDDLLGAAITASDGTPVPIGEIASLEDGPSEQSVMVETLHRRNDGALNSSSSVLRSVEMKRGEIIHQFDTDVRALISEQKGKLPVGAEIITVSDQPAAMAHRIGLFLHCFIEAVIIVVLVTLLLMDWRTAVVVAAAIPLTLAMTLGGMSLMGIPLQQISVVALIIALGMLVDDPVVAADGINRELAAGSPRAVAAWLGPYKLRRAIFFGTLINIAAFLPLALLPGDMGAFIISLPVVVTLALVSSRIVSLTFIPLLGYHLLRGQRGFEQGGEVRHFVLLRPVDRLLARALPRFRMLLQRALTRPGRILAIAYGLLVLSCGLTPFFGKQFFPAADRGQMLVDIELPEGSSLRETRAVCRKVTAALADEAAVRNAVISSGTGVPMFYYNMLPREPGSHAAQILINTRSADDVAALLVKLRSRFDKDITGAGARCIVKQLQQGPAMDAPIEVQIKGDNLETLRAKAADVSQALCKAGAYKVHDDFGPPIPQPGIQVRQEAASEGITAIALVSSMIDVFRGIMFAELQDGEQVVPVYLRAPAEALRDAGVWRDFPVPGPGGQTVPFEKLASIIVREDYPVISRINGQRAVTVKALAPFGELASNTLERAKPEIEQTALPPGWSLGYAGEERELKNSQREMARVMAISLALIALTMLVQFRSLMKSLVVMLTVPLGLVGAFVGLATIHASFGFMALLAIVSLAGVIVSHIIVLADFIEEAREGGMPLEQALVQAGLVRFRAVLATVLATVCGLIPLAVSGGPLWQPLTSVHIFGLLFATVLTLLVLPVLYYLFCAKLKWMK